MLTLRLSLGRRDCCANAALTSSTSSFDGGTISDVPLSLRMRVMAAPSLPVGPRRESPNSETLELVADCSPIVSSLEMSDPRYGEEEAGGRLVERERDDGD